MFLDSKIFTQGSNGLQRSHTLVSEYGVSKPQLSKPPLIPRKPNLQFGATTIRQASSISHLNTNQGEKNPNSKPKVAQRPKQNFHTKFTRTVTDLDPGSAPLKSRLGSSEASKPYKSTSRLVSPVNSNTTEESRKIPTRTIFNRNNSYANGSEGRLSYNINYAVNYNKSDQKEARKSTPVLTTV